MSFDILMHIGYCIYMNIGDIAPCKRCGTQFKAKAKNQLFCTPECRIKSWSYNIEKVCQGCNNPYKAKDSRQKFCNRRCSAKYNNLLRGITIKDSNRPCEFGECTASLKKHQAKFCSRGHANEADKQKRISQWLDGNPKVASYADGSLASWAKEYLLTEANWKCKCGWSEPNPKLGRPILCIDHIDGNWTNNARSNLEVLCYNCHTLTPTFGALNIGSASGRRPGEGKRRNKDLLRII